MVSKGKKPIIEQYSYDTETKAAHRHTRLKIDATSPRDYRRLEGGSNEEYEEHSDYSAIATLRSHASS